MNTWHTKIEKAIRKVIASVEFRLKPWTLPSSTHQTISTLVDLNRSKPELMAENMSLRQQLIVLERQVECPHVTQRDRQILVLLASRLQAWRNALIIVKPDTLIGWHRLGFKLYWQRKSRVRQGRPPLAVEAIALIKEMCVHNRTWRVKRIQGERFKVGIRVSKETIKKYMRQVQKGMPPLERGQTWTTFLTTHARVVKKTLARYVCGSDKSSEALSLRLIGYSKPSQKDYHDVAAVISSPLRIVLCKVVDWCGSTFQKLYETYFIGPGIAT